MLGVPELVFDLAIRSIAKKNTFPGVVMWRGQRRKTMKGEASHTLYNYMYVWKENNNK